ncbi:hypothetical protein [Senegalimassilia faecalis]|uniref:VG15 protein n=1 Tax=Senegalimassilia faecalis TaxID=2509433 RepID=UPI003076B5BA
MISAAEFAAYNREVAGIGDRAASDVESSVLAWCRSHEDATVAEKREAAKLIMEGFVQGYDDVAAEFAAQWYDHRAEQGGARLEQAITTTTYKPESVDAVARYQAKKLAKGGDAAFAKACGEFARDDAFRSLNETIAANVGRDKDKGVRFARVPTGFETCTFCLMLASRGAVYHTRKTAGEFKRFHRRCDCKIVPGFGDDPDAELVEGVRPKELYERYKQFKEIDEDESLTSADKDAAKRAVLGSPGPPVVYKKPKEAFAHERGGSYDLAAHEALRAAGHEVVVRKEGAPEGFSNIDLLLDGKLCELKSPTSDASGVNGLRFIERNIRKAVKQFEKVEGGPVRPSIVVLNCEEVHVARKDALKRVRLEMSRHEIDRVILLTRGGAIDDIKK